MDHTAATAAADATLCGKLETLLPILDAFNYRHRNQHSASHWWSEFRQLRRNAHALAEDLSRHQTLHKLQTEKKSTSAKNKARTVQKQLLARAVLLRDHTIPKSYICFSQLIADKQHATLGLLLLSTLARVNSVLTPILPPPEPVKAEKLRRYSLEKPPARPTGSDADTRQPSAASGEQRTDDVSADRDGDRGVAIARGGLPAPKEKPRKLTSSAPPLDGDAQPKKRTLASVEKPEEKQKKKKPKKKGKGDELSSLFGSL